MANLCRLLSGWADRDVIDKTGISADMFTTAVESLSKMGLKLAPACGRGGYLVIDHVERPAGN